MYYKVIDATNVDDFELSTRLLDVATLINILGTKSLRGILLNKESICYRYVVSA
jgi:hypothetical protein